MSAEPFLKTDPQDDHAPEALTAREAFIMKCAREVMERHWNVLQALVDDDDYKARQPPTQERCRTRP